MVEAGSGGSEVAPKASCPLEYRRAFGNLLVGAFLRSWKLFYVNQEEFH